MPTIQYQERQRPERIVLDEGEYNFVITKAENEIAKKSGNDMIKITAKEKNTGVEITDYLVFTENTFYKIEDALRACGHQLEKGKIYDIEPGNFIGRRLKAKIGIEDNVYNGKTTKQNRIIDYITENPPKQPDLPHSELKTEKPEEADAFGTTNSNDDDEWS
jgi:hypothetical protein